jgi:hypothetical protein
VLPLSIFNALLFPQGHPIAAYVFFLVFPWHLSFLSVTCFKRPLHYKAADLTTKTIKEGLTNNRIRTRFWNSRSLKALRHSDGVGKFLYPKNVNVHNDKFSQSHSAVNCCQAEVRPECPLGTRFKWQSSWPTRFKWQSSWPTQPPLTAMRRFGCRLSGALTSLLFVRTPQRLLCRQTAVRVCCGHQLS